MKNKYEIRGDVTAIYLKHFGETVETLIDTNDLEKIKSFRNTWGINNTSYVQGILTDKKKATYILLHRFILDIPKDKVGDHINHDKLDNRRINLRAITNQENVCNAPGARSDNTTSGHLGVSWNRRYQKWVVQTRVFGIVKFRKLFEKDDLVAAKKAADESRAYYMPTSKEARENNNPDMEKYDVDPETPTKANKTSGVKNIYWKKSANKWVVQFNINKKQTEFGRFKILGEAIEKANEIRKTI